MACENFCDLGSVSDLLVLSGFPAFSSPSDFLVRSQNEEKSDLKKGGKSRAKKGSLTPKAGKNSIYISVDSVPTPMVRGYFGDKVPLLHARPYVASSPGSPLPHLLHGHGKLRLVGCSAIIRPGCSFFSLSWISKPFFFFGLESTS